MTFRLLLFLSLLQSGQLLADSKVVLCLGDSLTAGYDIPSKHAWPHLVETQLLKSGQKVEVINAGISGSTSASGVGRFQWHLKSKGAPHILILALGANDGLRGQSTEAMKKNLLKIIEKAQEKKVTVLFAGMKMPPNYGKEYTQKFEKVFVDIAKEKKLPFIPFFLEGVAAQPKLNLPDGVHPNSKGHQIMADLVLKHLLPLFKA